MRHWHKPTEAPAEAPSKLKDPPPCCRKAFDLALGKERARLADEVADAVREERRRIVTGAAEALAAYRESTATVLTDPEQVALVDRVATHAAELIRRAGCICGHVDVHTFGQAKPRRMPDRDPLCGVHEAVVPMEN